MWGNVAIDEDDLAQLEVIARSRTAPASWVERARILLAYRADPSAYAVGEAIGVTHQTVLRCLDRAERLGMLASPDDSPRPGKAPQITDDAKAWLVWLACEKSGEHGYPRELWTHDCWRTISASMWHPPLCIPASPVSLRARSAKSLIGTR